MKRTVRKTTRGKTVWIEVNRGNGPERTATYGNTLVGTLAFGSMGQGYHITHVTTGRRVATAPNQQAAERVARVLSPHFTSDNKLTKQGKQLYIRLVEDGVIVFQVVGHVVQVIKAGAMS